MSTDRRQRIGRPLLMALVAGVMWVVSGFGCQQEDDDVYVDRSNTTAPWDGTQANPFQTIQEGLNAAARGEFVLVAAGQYNENVTMNKGRKLVPWGDNIDVVIQGASGAPVIRSLGNNIIRGMTIQGGNQAILLDLADALGGLTGDRAEAFINVIDCEIRNSIRGIQITSPANLAFGTNERRTFRLIAQHNWIHDFAGSGIISDLNGPTTGWLQISLDVKDNVFQTTNTGITLYAKGQGPNPGGFVRASYSGFVTNNLFFGNGTNGMVLDAQNLGSLGSFIINNTFAEHFNHGIIASTTTGPDGDGSVSVKVIRNIFANNAMYGYIEFTGRTSPSEFSFNLFHNNGYGHYRDDDTDTVLNSVTELNTPMVGNSVVFWSGSGNIVGDPLFADGVFPWRPGVNNTGGAHRFFLTQNGTTSPAVDAGGISVTDAEFFERSTRTDMAFDVGTLDIGFHYKNP